MAGYRMIGGKKYILWSLTDKEHAKRVAKGLRKDGDLVRVIKRGKTAWGTGIFGVYRRRP